MSDPGLGEGPYAVHHGNGASMWHLSDGDANLVLTSPPYYTDETEMLLRAPVIEQDHVEEVDDAVTSLALSLAPVFHEIARVLRADGKLILQTRDLRYGGYLIGPADTHRRLAEAAGFRLMAEIAWESAPARISRDKALHALWRRGQFVTAEVEKFLVFARTPIATELRATPVDAPDDFAEPLWRMPAQGSRGTHQHESPISVLRRLIELYTEPDEIVVDPMCGHGTTMIAALELGRRGIGYDIDPACVTASLDKIERLMTRRKLGR